MPVIVVANPKGGVGKTTLSTNLAGMLASRGQPVLLGDADRQQSARTWLDLRPPGLPAIGYWDGAREDTLRPPKGPAQIVLDTPAGLHGKRLDEVFRVADKILIPLQPSIFDIHASHDFIEQMRARKRADKLQVALVGMRTREGTISSDQLRTWFDGVGLPMLGFLRDTQNYVHLAAHGLSLWDVATTRVERDQAQWQPIAAWLDS